MCFVFSPLLIVDLVCLLAVESRLQNGWLSPISDGDLRDLEPNLVCRSDLNGWLSPLSDRDFRDLELAYHPSLLTHNEKLFVLIGALSLVNHSWLLSVLECLASDL